MISTILMLLPQIILRSTVCATTSNKYKECTRRQVYYVELAAVCSYPMVVVACDRLIKD